MNKNTDKLLSIYKNCLESRYLDEQFQIIFHRDKKNINKSGYKREIRGFFTGVGAEVGPGLVASLLNRDDYLIPHYRGYSAIINKGASLNRISAAMFEKKTSPAKGFGNAGSFPDTKYNILDSSVSLGTNFSIAIGLAFAVNFKKQNKIVAQFFGDGGSSRTIFGSALNLASLWNLPILFVCENNGISINSPISKMSSTTTIAERAQGYNLKSDTLYDLNPLDLYECAKKAIGFVRKTRKPYLLEIVQKRHTLHLTAYDKKPILGKNIPRAKDPLICLEDVLRELGVQEKKLTICKRKSRMRVNSAIKKARSAVPLSDKEFQTLYFEDEKEENHI